jgi:hypothetical protein
VPVISTNSPRTQRRGRTQPLSTDVTQARHVNKATSRTQRDDSLDRTTSPTLQMLMHDRVSTAVGYRRNTRKSRSWL